MKGETFYIIQLLTQLPYKINHHRGVNNQMEFLNINPSVDQDSILLASATSWSFWLDPSEKQIPMERLSDTVTRFVTFFPSRLKSSSNDACVEDKDWTKICLRASLSHALIISEDGKYVLRPSSHPDTPLKLLVWFANIASSTIYFLIWDAKCSFTQLEPYMASLLRVLNSRRISYLYTTEALVGQSEEVDWDPVIKFGADRATGEEEMQHKVEQVCQAILTRYSPFVVRFSSEPWASADDKSSLELDPYVLVRGKMEKDPEAEIILNSHFCDWTTLDSGSPGESVRIALFALALLRGIGEKVLGMRAGPVTEMHLTGCFAWRDNPRFSGLRLEAKRAPALSTMQHPSSSASALGTPPFQVPIPSRLDPFWAQISFSSSPSPENISPLMPLASRSPEPYDKIKSMEESIAHIPMTEFDIEWLAAMFLGNPNFTSEASYFCPSSSWPHSSSSPVLI